MRRGRLHVARMQLGSQSNATRSSPAPSHLPNTHGILPTRSPPSRPQVLSLAAWYADVLKRYDQLAAWTAGPVGVPHSVWLSGLFNPKAFLTAVMQTYARANKLPLDVMRFVTDVTNKTPDQVGARPRGAGACVRGH